MTVPPFPSPTGTTIGHLLRAAHAYLDEHDVINPDWHAELLVGGILGLRRHEVHLKRDEPLPAGSARAIAAALERRAAGEPTQYILGETEFYSLKFRCDRRALIPRPETELLVDAAIAIAREFGEHSPAILELGTGSGCVSVALASQLPKGRIVAVDISPDALDLARENAQLHGVTERIEFRISNLFEHAPEKYDLIVGNLPYVATSASDSLPREVRGHEPPGALFAGPDGMAVLKRTIEAAPAHLHPEGALLLEIGYDQAEAVQATARAVVGLTAIELRPDYGGHLRLLVARKS